MQFLDIVSAGIAVFSLAVLVAGTAFILYAGVVL